MPADLRCAAILRRLDSKTSRSSNRAGVGRSSFSSLISRSFDSRALVFLDMFPSGRRRYGVISFLSETTPGWQQALGGGGSARARLVQFVFGTARIKKAEGKTYPLEHLRFRWTHLA